MHRLVQDNKDYCERKYGTDFTLVMMCGIFLIFGINTILNYAILVLFLIGCVKLMNEDALELVCFPLYFFDYVLVLDNGITFHLVYEFVFLFWLFVFKKNAVMKKQIFWFSILFLAQVLVAKFSISYLVSASLNIIVLALAYSRIVEKKQYDRLLRTISIAGVFASLYAVTRLNFEYGFRLLGTMTDPNFSAYLYVLGIVATITCNLYNNKTKIFLTCLMAVTLLLTGSQTGIMATLIIILFISYQRKPSKSFLAIGGLLIFIWFFLTVNLSNIQIIGKLQSRIFESLNAIRIGDYDSLTSYRFTISQRYFDSFVHNTGLFNKLFGGIDSSQDVLINMAGLPFTNILSHNSYIDMLFGVGAVGTVIIVVSIMYFSVKGLKIYKHTGDETYLGMASLKIVMAIFAMFLSFFATKPFNFIYLLLF